MMKRQLLLISFLLCGFFVFSQPIRIAILDFENISGIAKYNGLGKAMSSMLISDIESNVSPKRLQLVERAQINKIMKEQNLQKSASFDKNTAVKMGKLLGVNFLLIGDIYILDNALVINARLTDAATGDIKFSEKQEGKINEWLIVKSKLGKVVSTSLSMPFTEPRVPDAIIAPAVLTTYASAIDENDKGNFEKAETLIKTAKDFSPDFGYLDDLRDEVEKLKKQVAEQGKKIEVLEKSGGRVINAKSYDELLINMKNDLTSFEEKKKIFIEIINNYSEEWNKDSNRFFYLINKQFDFNNIDLHACNLFMTDMIKLRQLIKKEKLQFFHKEMYSLLGNLLYISTKKIYFNHDFSEADYDNFRSIMSIIIYPAFPELSDQTFADFILMTSFNYDNTSKYLPFIKRDILNIQKAMYLQLKYPYVNQVMKRCESDSSEFYKSENKIGYKSILLASQDMINFLASNNISFNKIKTLFNSIYFITDGRYAQDYYFNNNIQNQSSIESYLQKLNKICQFFSVPLIAVKDANR